MRDSQIFGNIDSFLKPVLNIFILRNLVLGLEVVIKEKAGIFHQVYRFWRAVNSWGE